MDWVAVHNSPGMLRTLPSSENFEQYEMRSVLECRLYAKLEPGANNLREPSPNLFGDALAGEHLNAKMYLHTKHFPPE